MGCMYVACQGEGFRRFKLFFCWLEAYVSNILGEVSLVYYQPIVHSSSGHTRMRSMWPVTMIGAVWLVQEAYVHCLETKCPLSMAFFNLFYKHSCVVKFSKTRLIKLCLGSFLFFLRSSSFFIEVFFIFFPFFLRSFFFWGRLHFFHFSDFWFFFRGHLFIIFFKAVFIFLRTLFFIIFFEVVFIF